MYRWELLHTPFIGRFIRSRFYPGIFQHPLLVLFLFALIWDFLGTVRASENVATLMIWDGQRAPLAGQQMPEENPFIRMAQTGIVLLGIMGSMVVLMRSDRLDGGNPHFKWNRIIPI